MSVPTTTCDKCNERLNSLELIWLSADDFEPFEDEELGPDARQYDAVCSYCYDSLLAQKYTSCNKCDWFGIPWIDDGAPEFCDKCLQEVIDTTTDPMAYIEAQDDLQYFRDRQEFIEPSDRRYNLAECEVAS